MKLNIRAAGGAFAGVLFLALALPLPEARAQALADVTDLSSQHDPRVSAVRRGAVPSQGARPGAGGPPAGFRGPGPRGPVGVVNPAFRPPGVPRGPGVAQGYRPPAGVVAPGYRGPVAPRGPVGVVGPGYRGPAPGFRGPAPGFRGPAYGFRPSWRGGRAAFIRGPYRVRRGGLLLPLVGLGALSAIYVGSRAYTPYAFVDGPAGGECVGPTDDGICELRLTEAPLESGGAELVCVAYCPPE